MKSDEELKQNNPLLFDVARKGATEAPFSGEYVHTKEDGMYHCAVCNAPLFSSKTKFESNSGWPSFTDPEYKDAITLHVDKSFGTKRTEVRCAKCDAHLGHVFKDGPMKDRKICDRFCINSVSLALKKDEKHDAKK